MLWLDDPVTAAIRIWSTKTNLVAAMEMHQIRYFLALCEERNFTRAAERCNVAQPSLTSAIRLLQEEFGGALVNRERANTHLSELGQMMRPHLADVYGQVQLARNPKREYSKTAKRLTLRLGVHVHDRACAAAQSDGWSRAAPSSGSRSSKVIDATARDPRGAAQARRT